MTNPKLTPQQQIKQRLLAHYGDSDHITQSNRQTILDALYHLDGRHLDGHPLKGTYTGLWQAVNL